MVSEPIIKRVYDLVVGDKFIWLGGTYTVRKIINGRIYFFKQSYGRYNGNLFSLGEFSQERVEIVKA